MLYKILISPSFLSPNKVSLLDLLFPFKESCLRRRLLGPLDLKCRLPGRHCSVEFWFAERGRDLVAVIRRLCVWYLPSLCAPEPFGTGELLTIDMSLLFHCLLLMLSFVAT